MNIIPALITVASVVSLLTGVSTDKKEAVLSQHAMSLQERYAVPSVNEVFKDNILLTLVYMDGKTGQSSLNWEEIRKPASYGFTLRPGETFAFHNNVLDQFKGKVVKTTNAHFGLDQGFKSDGYLFGDGVCHLASLLYWVAKDAKLAANAPTSHDFAAIPQIPKEYGVSIYDVPGQASANASASQNLYITNTKEHDVTFTFSYSQNQELTITASESE